MPYETVLYERKDGIAYITLNRPEVLNAVNDALATEVAQAFRDFDIDEQAGVAILSGRGRCFCSGADIRQRQLLPREELIKRGGPGGLRPSDELLGLGRTINWKPVIAAVHGYALGAGFALAMECDLIVAADDAQFEITEASRGLGGAPHWVKAWFWGGARMATEMVLTGRRLSAAEACALGMVNRAVPASQMLAEAEQMAQRVLSLPPLSVRCNVRVSRWHVREMMRFSEGYQQALKLYLTEDFQESARAWAEKREPVFKGR